MVNKKFVALTCLALAVGLLIGLVSFRNEFIAPKSLTIESDLVYAYFRTMNVSQSVSGVGYTGLVAYVIVLNVTNPTSDTFRISDLRLAYAENGSSMDAGGASLTNGVVSYYRDFSDNIGEYYWYPHTSRLVAFTGTDGLSNLALSAINKCSGVFYAYLSCIGIEEKAVGSSYIFKELSLENPSANEFVYNSAFKDNNYFMFHNDHIDLEYGSGRMG